MQTRSNTWKSLAALGWFDTETRAIIAGVEYTTISPPIIDRMLFTGNLSVGGCNAASCKFSIMTDNAIPSGAQVVIQARISNNGTTSEWRTFGTFYIESRVYDRTSGMLALTCYDAILKANEQYLNPAAVTDAVAAQWPKTMSTCVTEIASRIGVQVDSRTTIKSGDAYKVPIPVSLSQNSSAQVQNYTLREVLGYIAACHAGNWIITPENKLRLVPLVDLQSETYDVVDQDYNNIYTSDGYNLVSQSYSTQDDENAAGGEYLRIPVVTGSVKDMPVCTLSKFTMVGDSKKSFSHGDATGNELVINCPYACQEICDDIYRDFNGLRYRPFMLTDAHYDPCAELGDWIVAGDKVQGFIVSQTMKFDINFRATVSAPGEESVSEYPYLTSYEKLEQATENLRLYTKAVQDEAKLKIEQTDSSLRVEISSVNTTLSSNISGVSDRVTVLETSDQAIKASISDIQSDYLKYSDVTITTDEVKITHAKRTTSFNSSDYVKFSNISVSENGISITRSGTTTTFDGQKYLTTSSISLTDNGIKLSVASSSVKDSEIDLRRYVKSTEMSISADGVTLNHVNTNGTTTTSSLDTTGYATGGSAYLSNNGFQVDFTNRKGTTLNSGYGYVDLRDYTKGSEFSVSQSGISYDHTGRTSYGNVSGSLSTASYLTGTGFSSNINGTAFTYTYDNGSSTAYANTGNRLSICERIQGETNNDVIIESNRLIVNSTNFKLSGSGTINATGTITSTGTAYFASYNTSVQTEHTMAIAITAGEIIARRDGSQFGSMGYHVQDANTGRVWMGLNGSSCVALYGSSQPKLIVRGSDSAFSYYEDVVIYGSGRCTGDMYVRALVVDNNESTGPKIYKSEWNSNTAAAISSAFYVFGDLGCSGTKNRIVETDTYGHVALNAIESSGAYFSDMGSCTVDEGGRAYILFDPVFAETVDLRHEYQIFITPTSSGANGAYVEKGTDYCILHSAPGTTFDWIVYAKQKDYVNTRLEVCEAPVKPDAYDLGGEDTELTREAMASGDAGCDEAMRDNDSGLFYDNICYIDSYDDHLDEFADIYLGDYNNEIYEG